MSQNTLHTFFLDIKFKNTLVVHYDADLYTATLYAVLKLDGKKMAYCAILDEFAVGEARAPYSYIEMIKAKVEFFENVFWKITHRGFHTEQFLNLSIEPSSENFLHVTPLVYHLLPKAR